MILLGFGIQFYPEGLVAELRKFPFAGVLLAQEFEIEFEGNESAQTQQGEKERSAIQPQEESAEQQEQLQEVEGTSSGAPQQSEGGEVTPQTSQESVPQVEKEEIQAPEESPSTQQEAATGAAGEVEQPSRQSGKTSQKKANPYGNVPVFSPYLILGSEDVSGVTYQKVGLLGELAFDSFGFPLGIGLNIVVRFNEDGIRKEDWDFGQLKTYTNMIRYIRWGRKGIPPVYARIGYLSDVFLGNGVLVRRYTNISSADIEHKVNRIGFESWLNLKLGPFSGGLEFFTNSLHPVSWTDISYSKEPLAVYIPSLGVNGTVELNVEERLTRNDAAFRVIGLRAFVNPLYPLFKEGILSRVELGTSYVVDRAPGVVLSQNKTYAEESGDHYVIVKDIVYESGGSPLYAWGIDWSLPFGAGPVNIRLYSEADYMDVPVWSLPSSEKWGFIPVGFVVDLPRGFSFTADYRNFGSGFVPYVFDSSYESSRLEGIESMQRRQGFYTALSWNGLSFLNVSLTYQHMIGSDAQLYDAMEGRVTVNSANMTSFHSLPTFVQNIKNFEIFYYQRDIDWSFQWWKSLSTRFGASLLYGMGGANLRVTFLGYFDYNMEGDLVLKTSFDVSTEIGF